VKTRLAMSAVLCGFALTACSAGGTATPVVATSAVPTAAAAPSPNASASEQAAYESYHAALQSNEATIALQVAGLPAQQLYALALQWEQAPITGDPLQTARAVWASAYFANLKTAQPPVVAAPPQPLVPSPTKDQEQAVASQYQTLLGILAGCGRPDCPTPTVTVTPTANPECAELESRVSRDLDSVKEYSNDLHDALNEATRNNTASMEYEVMIQSYQDELNQAQQAAESDQNRFTEDRC
jgi:hypothetical protein